MPRALTDNELDIFNAIRDASNMALIQVTYRGEETAAIAAVNADGITGDYIITPLAILVTSAMMDQTQDPTGDYPELAAIAP
jgi:hypothetical protein